MRLFREFRFVSCEDGANAKPLAFTDVSPANIEMKRGMRSGTLEHELPHRHN